MTKIYRDAVVAEARKVERLQIERHEMPHSTLGRMIVDVIIAVERAQKKAHHKLTR